VGLALFDDAERHFLRPVATQARFTKFSELLEETQAAGTTELGMVMRKVSEQIQSRG